MKKIIFKILIIALTISAIFGIAIILLNLWNETTAKILATTGLIFGFSIPGLCCSSIYEKEGLKTFSIVGMVICLLSCLYYLILIWDYRLIEFLTININLKIIPISILLSLSFGHISLLLLICSDNDTVKALRNLTIMLSGVLDIILLVGIFTENFVDWHITTILSILIALGTIVTPIVNKLIKSNNDTPTENNNINNINNDDKYTKLAQLKQLLDSNAITEEEYNNEKNKILNS